MRSILIYLSLILFCGLSFGQNYDAELVHQEANISIKSGKLFESIKYEIKINNREGEKYADVSIPFSRLIKISKIEGFVKDGKGIIVKKLQKNDITEKSSISDYSLYQDYYRKEFTLKHNSYPYTIFYTYELQQDEFLCIDDWIPVIDLKIPTLNAVLSLELPKNFRIAYCNKNIDNFNCDSTGLLTKYVWVASYTKIIEPESYSPDAQSFLPDVNIVPVNFKYDLPGSMRNWSSYGEWEYELLKDLSDLPQSEKNAVLDIVAGISDEKEKIKRLYHYLQDRTRYVNVTIETGGIKPYPASYVSQNKYGDCKALSNYFKSVLECAGFKSYYTDVLAGDVIKEIDKSFPSQQFNHVILCVPIKNDTLWLDCTSDMAFNYLGTFTQARDVFIVDKDKSHFSRTPGLSISEITESRRVTFHQDSLNKTISDFSNIYRGDKYETFFSLLKSVNNADRKQILRTKVVKNGFELIDYSLISPPRDSAKITLNYSARSSDIYNIYGNDLIIKVLPFSFPRLEAPGKRKLPVQINYPIYEIDSLEYEIPSGYTVTQKPPDMKTITEFGWFKSESVIKDSKVQVYKSFLLYSGKYPLEKYSAFHEFLTKAIELENSNIVVGSKKL